MNLTSFDTRERNFFSAVMKKGIRNTETSARCLPSSLFLHNAVFEPLCLFHHLGVHGVMTGNTNPKRIHDFLLVLKNKSRPVAAHMSPVWYVAVLCVRNSRLQNVLILYDDVSLSMLRFNLGEFVIFVKTWCVAMVVFFGVFIVSSTYWPRSLKAVREVSSYIVLFCRR